MGKFLDIYKKHREIISYIIVGVLTTVISLIFYYVCTRTFLDPDVPVQLQIANIIKWISGVTFSYVASKLFVFHSKRRDILKEFLQFASSRLITLVLDMLIMAFFVTKLNMYDMIANFISLVIVTITNYILSKWFVFKEKPAKN